MPSHLFVRCKMQIQQVKELIQKDMSKVDELIVSQLHSDVALINQLSYYIIMAGGKRLRPQLTVLAANAMGYSGLDHYTLAVVVEFIHTATLLHDDVVDASDMRRGKSTANAEFGNEASILVGDFLYSRAFEMMVGVKIMRVMEILANATNIIAEGEVLQLLNTNDPSTTEAGYMQVIHSKTAKLFEAAAQLGAVLAKATKDEEQALADYGKYLGTAFQLVDDVLDYSVDVAQTGKNIGDDLAEGKPTLPLIHAMEHASSLERDFLKSCIEQGGANNFDKAQDIINKTGALRYTMDIAKREAQLAVNALQPVADSDYKQALLCLAEFAVTRAH